MLSFSQETLVFQELSYSTTNKIQPFLRGLREIIGASQKLPLLKSRGTNKRLHLFQPSAAWSQRGERGENPDLEGCIPAGLQREPRGESAQKPWLDCGPQGLGVDIYILI